MKKYLALLIFALTIIACCPNAANYHVPQGYKTCHSSWDCNYKAGEFCGFVGVDTYAVCRH